MKERKDKMKNINEKETKKLEELISNAKYIVLMTNQGGAIVGSVTEILNLFANIVLNLKESGIEEKDLKKVLEIGYNTERTPMKEDILKKCFQDTLKEIQEALNDLLGEDNE